MMDFFKSPAKVCSLILDLLSRLAWTKLSKSKSDKRETDPEYLLKLEEYQRGQEKLRLKQEDFAKRQREYAEKKEKKKAEQARRLEILDEQRERQQTKKAGER